MLLWNIIRDFFVMYIFGGFTSDGKIYSNVVLGHFIYVDDIGESLNSASYHIPFFGYDGGYVDTISYYCLGDYLSTTATIIVLVVLAVVVALGIRWLFRFLISRFTKWGL